LNTTEAEQEPAAARLLPHPLLLMLKSPAFVPEMATLLIEMLELVPFVNLADCDALLDPTFTVPNERLDGLTVTLALVPRPDNATVCGLPLPLSLKSSVAVRVPVVVGAKTMLTVQLDEAARLVPHVSE
jgi:hypothetical protein